MTAVEQPAYVCIPDTHETGWLTCIDGMTLHTRFHWSNFDERWQRELVRYARAQYDVQRPSGCTVNLVAFDHINIKRETFQPRVDLRLRTPAATRV